MKTIGLIPLDSRPCNTLWLEQLAKIAGYNMLMYPRKSCGDLFKGASFLDQLAWLKENAQEFDYLIISLDGLTSGGLVQTRTGNANLELINANLNFLAELKALNPNLKIYLFDTLMRTSITTLSNETAKYWALMNEFSRLKGEIYFNNREEDRKKLDEITKQIPNEIIEKYLNARNIKHTIDKLAIDLVKQGLADYLIILQEDSMPNGIQQIEQSTLISLINENNLNDKIKFYNGTDEGALLLFAKIILLDNNLAPNIYLHLPYAGALDKTMLFEDRPFITNLKLMFETINFKFSSYEDADFVLSIYTEKENVDLDLATTKEVKPTNDAIFKNYINELNTYIKEKDVCFVDLLFPNGGSTDILKLIDFKNLKCYSAWNTASNSLGSALANVASMIVAKHNKLNSLDLATNFKLERILDDALYQYEVRRIVSEKLLEENVNIYNLGNKGEEVLALVTKLMEEKAIEYTEKKFTVTLPWNRMFEAEIIIKGE